VEYANISTDISQTIFVFHCPTLKPPEGVKQRCSHDENQAQEQKSGEKNQSGEESEQTRGRGIAAMARRLFLFSLAISN